MIRLPWVRIVVAAGLLGAGFTAGWATSSWRSTAILQAERAAHAQAVAAGEQWRAEMEARYRDREQKIQEKVDVIAAQALAIAQERQHERAAAGRTAAGLRDAVHAVAAQCSARAAADPGTAAAGPAASAPGDLLAYVHRRLDEAAGGIAAHADDAADAGRFCERTYDEVRKTYGGR